jgi:hypothetical protein
MSNSAKLYSASSFGKFTSLSFVQLSHETANPKVTHVKDCISSVRRDAVEIVLSSRALGYPLRLDESVRMDRVALRQWECGSEERARSHQIYRVF